MGSPTKKPLAELIERILNDAVLGFLALVSLFLLIAPAVFPLSEVGLRSLLVIEYVIVLLFAAEYMAGLVLAADKKRFILNRWRIIDGLIVVGAAVALLPGIPNLLSSSPVLRLLRLGRLALLGTRSGLALAAPRESAAVRTDNSNQPLKVLALDASGRQFETSSWESALERIGRSEPDWLFMSGVTESNLTSIAAALRVPEKAVHGLFQSSVPRFDRLEQFSTLFMRYPFPMKPGDRLRRTPVLLVGTAENVVVLCREHTDLTGRVEARLGDLQDDTPRMIRATAALLSEFVRAYTSVTEQLESSLLTIETGQSALKDSDFLEKTFNLRADILRVRSSLKHLKNAMRDLFRGDMPIPVPSDADRELFRLLAEDVNDLFDGIEDLRESLQSLVDLRLNVSSFQMNRVMRLLALLTSLALIPATAGGLLGMNLQGTPWAANLAQVSFGVAAGMALSLYVFAVKGWLR